MKNLSNQQRIVITGVGLTAPGASSLEEFRANLLAGKSGVSSLDLRFMGVHPAGLCTFAETRYRKKRENKRGTRAGCIGVYCANEALVDAGIDFSTYDKAKTGVYIGLTEHGTVETENEVYNISQYDYNVDYWTHHHNPRTVVNNPAGEITMNLGITGPHYAIGAACAAGNAALIQGIQMLRLGEVELALCGGLSESVGSFGIFASFRSQGALAEHEDPTKASRPFDQDRNGIVISEGGCVFTLERLDRALERGAKIYGEITGYAMNSDARDFVLPYGPRQKQCMEAALEKAGLRPDQVTLINAHATGTKQGDVEECNAIRDTFIGCENTWINNTKSAIGHAMGAAGVLELAGNLPSFSDNMVHPTINVDSLDPDCALPGLVTNTAKKLDQVDVLLNNSFGMLGINSVVIVERFMAN
ncbi:beta-ketoacyl-[acyl-carrier-protein] synthase family protein [Desulfobulbus rhabdoformis]|uniref:beta-ketoacyl-[acyl-carrier-protein] synthase family protein n=1 Tax=Desulfobulbus rhabdoformis TaxID=34032 RepID=UPI0019625A96|nr:beta-ketoacyl-[acyl-carrier-protein] synthase family protein [Desulfobulbus rhabdoformis]MBM9613431.1 beta-ketoacyl-[acyl-carrier-protein] synthase family protein [Desulfobulbus rhabdoformis]